MNFFSLVGEEASKERMGKTVSNFEERFEVLNQIKSIAKVLSQNRIDPIEKL